MAVLLTASGSSVGAEPSPDAQSLLAQAVAADLGTGGRGDATRAFALYVKAAAAGSAAAQLNAAVMLDSGRGTPHDAAHAATYYALAASQGVARAAYDIGQLYADGEGVPGNPGLARAWLHRAAEEGIAAATARMKLLGTAPPLAGALDTPTPPVPVVPSPGAVLARPAPLQFVWTAASQPAASQFYVQVASLQGTVPQDIFTAEIDVSAIDAKLTAGPGHYAWRVFTVCQPLGRYVASPWVPFSIL